MKPQAIGTHVLLEFWGPERSDDADFLGVAMAEAAIEAGFHVVQTVMHKFGGGGGVSGVVVLAESHITIHTWPEHGYAALDIFVCGDRDLTLAIELLAERLRPQRMEATRLERGQTSAAGLMTRAAS